MRTNCEGINDAPLPSEMHDKYSIILFTKSTNYDLRAYNMWSNVERSMDDLWAVLVQIMKVM